MGWRADEAYKKAQHEEFLAWRRSLAWGEWISWQAERHWAFVLGAGVAGAICWLTSG